MDRIAAILKLAQVLDHQGRPDLSDDIEHRLKEISYIMSLPMSQRSPFYDTIKAFVESTSTAGCTSCGSSYRYATFQDYTEDPELRALFNSIGSDQDIEDYSKYEKVYGRDTFPDQYGVLALKELLKTLHLQYSVMSEEYMDMLQTMDFDDPEEVEQNKELKNTLDDLEKQINENLKRWKQLRTKSNLN